MSTLSAEDKVKATEAIAAEHTGQVTSMAAKIDPAIEELENLYNRLEERLTAVIGPAETLPDSESPDGLVPLAHQLQSQVQRLTALIERHSLLINRIEV